MALRIVRVNGTHRHPKLPVINFMHPTRHYKGLRQAWHELCDQKFSPWQRPFDTDGTSGECPAGIPFERTTKL